MVLSMHETIGAHERFVSVWKGWGVTLEAVPEYPQVIIDSIERVRKAETPDVLVDHEVRLMRIESALVWAKAAALGAWATPVSILGVVVWRLVTNSGPL